MIDVAKLSDRKVIFVWDAVLWDSEKPYETYPTTIVLNDGCVGLGTVPSRRDLLKIIEGCVHSLALSNSKRKAISKAIDSLASEAQK